jgi:hypothetical protein
MLHIEYIGIGAIVSWFTFTGTRVSDELLKTREHFVSKIVGKTSFRKKRHCILYLITLLAYRLLKAGL